VIKKNLFRKLISELDEELGKSGHSYEITITGAGALIALNKISRATVDIDLIDPEIDSPLFKAAMIVGENNNLSYGWLNSAATSFADELPPGWQERTRDHVKGKHLHVKTLGRTDLIFSKLHAAAERVEQDFDDLLALKPTKEELERAKKHLLTLKDSQVFKDRVENLIKEANRLKKKRIGLER